MNPDKTRIVPLAAEHFDALIEIDKGQLGSRDNRSFLEKELELVKENPKTHFHLVALLDGDTASPKAVPAGHLSMKLAGDEASIERVAIAKAAEGRGTATLLILNALKLARDLKVNSLGLEARASNKRAQKIYSRFGLAPVGVRKNYYSPRPSNSKPVNSSADEGGQQFENAVLFWNYEVQSEAFKTRLEKIENEFNK